MFSLLFGKRRHPPDQHDDMDQIEGERGAPSVAKGKSLQAKLTNALAYAFIIVIAIVVLYKYYSSLWAQQQEAAQPKPTEPQASYRMPPLAAPQPPVRVPPQTFTPEPSPAPPVATSTPASLPVTQAPMDTGERELSPAEKLLQRRLQSPVKFTLTESSSGGAAPAADEPGAAVDGESGDSGRASELSGRLRPTVTSGTKATLLADRRFMLTKGTTFKCIMENALDTTLTGMVSCHVPYDVYGADRTVVLLDKYTKVVGEQTGQLNQGQQRAFVLWNRAETHHGVTINLDSPATDALGRSGIDGEVDTHFWARFGGAMLLSVIDDAVAGLTQSRGVEGSRNTVIAYGNTAQTAESLAAEVLKNTINIPPTLTTPQAREISIYVARDVDFRSVYDLEAD